jgi:hypothetical protein
VQRWNLPGGWVISARPAHPGLVSEADIIAAQAVSAAAAPCRPMIQARPKAGAGTAGRAAHLRAADGISLVQRQSRLPVPSRPHQRRPARSRPAEERLRPGEQGPGATACPAQPADLPAAARRRPGRVRLGGAAPDEGPRSMPRPMPGTSSATCASTGSRSPGTRMRRRCAQAPIRPSPSRQANPRAF